MASNYSTTSDLESSELSGGADLNSSELSDGVDLDSSEHSDEVDLDSSEHSDTANPDASASSTANLDASTSSTASLNAGASSIANCDTGEKSKTRGSEEKLHGKARSVLSFETLDRPIHQSLRNKWVKTYCTNQTQSHACNCIHKVHLGHLNLFCCLQAQLTRFSCILL